jgi:hypothetical protein
MNGANTSNLPRSLTVPLPVANGGPLNLILKAGDIVYIVGPNGSGKSALMTHLVSQIPVGRERRISAQRLIWSENDASTLTPSDFSQWDSNISNDSRSVRSRYLETWTQYRISLALSRLAAAEDQWLRKMRDTCTREDISVKAFEATNPNPLSRLNAILFEGTLNTEIIIQEGGRVVCRNRAGAVFGFSQMSDGEKNAFFISSDVLTHPTELYPDSGGTRKSPLRISSAAILVLT